MSRRTKKLQDIRAAKDRRAKKMAIGGAVLLVAILAFELPHYLGGSKSSSTAAGTTASTTTTGSTPSGATAVPAATASGTAATGLPMSATSTKLPNSDVAPSRTKSQLYSFDTFAGKDPFVQQVSATTQPGLSSPSGSSSSSAAGTSAPSSPAPAPTASSTSVRQTSARTLAAGGVAMIAVNGKTEAVRVGRSFPSANPVFRLVSLARGSANIGIANGSYTSGAQTIRLSSGRSVTLVDTADGVRYTVRLISAS
jgi:hypothetical protein